MIELPVCCKLVAYTVASRPGMHTLTADSVCTSPVRAAMQCYAVLQRTGLQTAICVLWLSADDTAYCLAHSVYIYIGCAYSNTVGVVSVYHKVYRNM